MPNLDIRGPGDAPYRPEPDLGRAAVALARRRSRGPHAPRADARWSPHGASGKGPGTVEAVAWLVALIGLALLLAGLGVAQPWLIACGFALAMPSGILARAWEQQRRGR